MNDEMEKPVQNILRNDGLFGFPILHFAIALNLRVRFFDVHSVFEMILLLLVLSICARLEATRHTVSVPRERANDLCVRRFVCIKIINLLYGS